MNYFTNIMNKLFNKILFSLINLILKSLKFLRNMILCCGNYLENNFNVMKSLYASFHVSTMMILVFNNSKEF